MLPVAADSTKLAENQYELAHNLRVRWGVLSPVRGPELVGATFNGANLQGHYSIGPVHVVFANGACYTKDYTTNGDYVSGSIPLLDADVEWIYAESIPESSFNFQRSHSSSDISADVQLLDATTGMPSCLVAQDGINQPVIILNNITGRVTQNYNQWTPTNPEYVPIGKQMCESGGILYIVSPDGKQIYRSVTGRCLDFMVNIQTDGSKEPLESSGGARSVSHSVGYSPLTCIAKLTASDNRIFAASLDNSWVVIPDYDSQIFGEPTFYNPRIGASGCVNQFSFVEVNGDSAFISTTGIRSFNAVAQDKNVGRNMPFSAAITPLLRDKEQTESCAIEFDDYILFSVDTIYGYGILVFDTTLDQYVSLDLLEIGQIKQFCKIVYGDIYKLFCITYEGYLYELFAGDFLQAQIFIGDFSSGEETVDLHPYRVDVSVLNASASGTIEIQPRINRALDTSVNLDYETGDNQALMVDINRTKTGYRVGYWLRWTGGCDISATRLASEPIQNDVSLEQRARIRRELMS